MREPRLEPIDEALDRLRLIAGGHVAGLQFKAIGGFVHALWHLSVVVAADRIP